MSTSPLALRCAQLLRYGWFAPWLVGLVWRVVAAASGFGWFAIDDYLFVIEKAALWQQAPDAPFGCDYRSTLLPRLMTQLLSFGHSVVGPDPAYALQVAYGALGIASTGTIIAVYYTAQLGAGPKAGRTSAWLAAVYAIMPRICTRALLESSAMLPVALSVWALAAATAIPQKPEARANTLHRPRHGLIALSALLCGVSAMVRFQAGILALPMLVWAIWPAGERRPGAWARGCSFMVGGFAATLLQAGLDVSEGRGPLSTPLAYVTYNLHNASRYGTSAWYTYLLQCGLLALPPACLLLGRRAWHSAWQTQRLACGLAVFFVATHSLIAHKEDRFLFPILPVLFVVLGTALSAHKQDAPEAVGPYHHMGRRLFWALNWVGLVVCSFSDAQRNWTVPLLRIARDTPPGVVRHLVVIEPDVVPSYYLDGRASWQGFADVPQFYAAALQSPQEVDYVLLRAMPDAQGQAMLTALGCNRPERFEGDVVDRLLVRVNRHNLRRAATTLLRCHAATPTMPKDESL